MGLTNKSLKYYYYPGYGYYQQQVQEPPSILTNLNISSAQKYQAPTVIESPQSSMEDYIKRAFEKCITVADRLAMSAAVKEVTAKAKQESINWATYPLPLLDREKLIAKAKEIEDKQTKIRERLDRFKDDFTTNNQNSISEVKPKIEKAISNTKNEASKKSRLIEPSGNVTLEEIASKNKIVGTCTNLEKQFFRLGADPDPAKVRPEHILKQSLKMLKKKWKHKEVEYRYMEEQFKSIRQDLVVQGIK